MSAVGMGFKTVALRLVAAPSAVFLAVLTAGLAASSTARYAGVLASNLGKGQRPSVVLACPRTRSAAVARGSASASATVPCRKFAARSAAAQATGGSRKVEGAMESPRAEKSAEAKAAGGGGRVSMPLPDFRTPALARFNSPF